MKRIFTLIRVFGLSILLVACVSQNNNVSDIENEKANETTVKTEQEVETNVHITEIEEENETTVKTEQEVETNIDITKIEEENETNTTTIKSQQGIRNESLTGRGISDSGRSEPNYVNVIGYVATYDKYISHESEDFKNTPWTVPTYEKDKQFYVENGTIEHKTEIIVRSQELEHTGYGNYSGYLLVERCDNNKQFYINVKNFITKPYWTYDDLEEAVFVGEYLAEFNQLSDYYPVNKSNDKVELDDGTQVLVVGKTGLYGRGGPDDDTNSIDAIVFKQWKYGYGGVHVFFNSEDLSIIY